MKGLLLFGICIILISGCDTCPSIDSWQITIPYCEHMGYTMEINKENIPICVFDDGTSCTTDNFYLGTCGQNKTKEFRLRTKCEDVYTEFERCEDGLIPSEPKYILEQSHCRKPFIFTQSP